MSDRVIQEGQMKHRHDVDRLSTPARKVFVEQLRKCTQLTESSSNNTCSCDKACWMWQANPSKPDQAVCLDIVWIQGTVMECYPESVVIHDGTGKITAQLNDVKKAKKVVSEEIMFSKGSYVMLVGSILSVGDIPSIRALKCSELKDPDIHQELWQSEVLHQQLFIYG